MVRPYVEVVDYCDPYTALQSFAPQTNIVLLDSAKLHPHLGRFSFIAVDPFAMFMHQGDVIRFDDQDYPAEHPFALLNEFMGTYPLEKIPELPPFQGGAAGFFSYDLCRALETIPTHALKDIDYPLMGLGFYDLVIAFDHHVKQAWVFSSGYPERDERARLNRAKARMQWCRDCLATATTQSACDVVVDEAAITSNFTEEGYRQAVSRVIDYITAGDLFEANISQRFSCDKPEGLDALGLYQRLRAVNPAPFSALVSFDDLHLISASPERFLHVVDQRVETRPIKGTRPRSQDPETDLQYAQALINSPKDHAENTMIVDLMRNDLSKVCLDSSIHVPQLCALESFETVHHLVSVVEGQLRAGHNAIDLLVACFPGGSITGAPKVRVLEVIDEIEPTRRGPYTGCIGYLGFNGDLDTSIVIRTLVMKGDHLTFQVGGAIILDSDPQDEYDETLVKAKALKAALTRPL